MWEIVWISFLSGMATPLGGLAAIQMRQVSLRLLALFLGMASGIMITVVVSNLMPASIESGGKQLFLTGFGCGWLFMFLLRIVMTKAMRRTNASGSISPYLQMGWFIAVAIALHDLPEGMAIGAGDAVAHQVGVVLALAIALHNIPEGLSIGVPLRMAGVRGWKIIWITLLAGLSTPLGTIISLGLFTVSTSLISLSLAFAAGAMVYVVARDIMPEALQADWPVAAVGIVAGAVLMTLLSGLH